MFYKSFCYQTPKCSDGHAKIIRRFFCGIDSFYFTFSNIAHTLLLLNFVFTFQAVFSFHPPPVLFGAWSQVRIFFRLLPDKFPSRISADFRSRSLYSAFSFFVLLVHVLFSCTPESSKQISCSQNMLRNNGIFSFPCEKLSCALCSKNLPQPELPFYNTCSVALSFSFSKRIKFISKRINRDCSVFFCSFFHNKFLCITRVILEFFLCFQMFY